MVNKLVVFERVRRPKERAPRGRVEIRTGVGRRRRWSEEQKGRIVAESYDPGAVVSEVARRHEISPQHLFAWRKAARTGLLVIKLEARTANKPPQTASDRLGKNAKSEKKSR